MLVGINQSEIKAIKAALIALETLDKVVYEN